MGRGLTGRSRPRASIERRRRASVNPGRCFATRAVRVAVVEVRMEEMRVDQAIVPMPVRVGLDDIAVVRMRVVLVVDEYPRQLPPYVGPRGGPTRPLRAGTRAVE